MDGAAKRAISDADGYVKNARKNGLINNVQAHEAVSMPLVKYPPREVEIDRAADPTDVCREELCRRLMR
jgi:hypothetical protein